MLTGGLVQAAWSPCIKECASPNLLRAKIKIWDLHDAHLDREMWRCCQKQEIPLLCHPVRHRIAVSRTETRERRSPMSIFHPIDSDWNRNWTWQKEKVPACLPGFNLFITEEDEKGQTEQPFLNNPISNDSFFWLARRCKKKRNSAT